MRCLPQPHSESNQIKSNQIKSNQIKSNQIKSNQIKSNQKTKQNKKQNNRRGRRLASYARTMKWSPVPLFVKEKKRNRKIIRGGKEVKKK
jgi:hypothetical protein